MMKHLIFTCMALLSMNLWAAEFQIDTENIQTMKSIYSIKMNSFQLSQKHNRCDEPRSEDWICEQEQVSRDSSLHERGCKGEAAWACFTNYKETCTERYSGNNHSRTYQEFDGCFPKLSDCW